LKLLLDSSAIPFSSCFQQVTTSVLSELESETAHFYVALLLGAVSIGFSVVPRRTGLNAAPAALTPLFVLLAPLAEAWCRIRGAWTFGPSDLVLTLLLAPQFLVPHDLSCAEERYSTTLRRRTIL
jgi:hypothetical protein